MNHQGYPYFSIIGRRGCKYTRKALSLCNDYKLSYSTHYPESQEEIESLKHHYNYYTLPIITICYPSSEEFVGGADSLEELIATYLTH